MLFKQKLLTSALSFLIFFIFQQSSYCQNLFDVDNSTAYATYLFANKEYAIAAREYERVLFMSENQNDSIRWLYIRSLRLSGRNNFAYGKMFEFYPDTNLASSALSNEYLRILLRKAEYTLVKDELNRLPHLDSNERFMYFVSSCFLAGDYKTALQTLDNYSRASSLPTSYENLRITASSIRRKSPLAAACLSAAVPGLGQTYAGNWKDGLFALAFTGSSAYQAYRGFSNKGTESIYGWGFSALAGLFYAANIYGSIKVANKYNVLNHLKISLQLEAILDNHYY